MIRYDAIWYMIRYDTISCDMIYDTIWYDIMWYDMIRYDTIRYDMIRYDICYDTICYDVIYDTIWYDTVWYDTIWYDIWHDTIYVMIRCDIWYDIQGVSLCTPGLQRNRYRPDISGHVTTVAKATVAKHILTFIFHQDGSPAHFHCDVRQYLNTVLPGRWIGRAMCAVSPAVHT
jgi:hypothetical protein